MKEPGHTTLAIGLGAAIGFLSTQAGIAHSDSIDQQEHKDSHGEMDHGSTREMKSMDMNHPDHGGTDHKMQGLYGPYSMTREASGTAWQPEATPMEGLHLMPGDWMLMFHGSAYGVYDYQGGHRGDRKF